ncbi:putative serine/threonine protein kinase [Mytilinidion resinicola]|uniref:non-specific serine/threonine protein kinase n=1 Tax=Mytilinidion resinicola TaxID=574789 RepID=A0A6A6YUL9_9PEZI|nr:putative serine/threonine protein kinase [Mytilinidion resinicola]KAF2811637.1 putative serine/threonine protein kinase [Mytilinidion resinicola]
MDCMRNQLFEGVVLDGRFETIAPLNHGSFGMVFQAKDLWTGDIVAIKCLTKTAGANDCSMFAVDDKSEELDIHLRIGSHPNIVNLIHSFETKNHIYLVLEFCSNGDLYEAIRLGKGPLQTQHVRDFMLQLVDAVEHMHSKGIYHRDIKPENIFLNQYGEMKLGDFGLATKDAWSFEAAVGSDRYMAPEQYDPSNFGYSTAKADIWAIGICLLNVLFSRNPFAVPATSDPLYADFALDKQTLFDVFPNMSQDTFEVLIHCMAIDPEKRSLSMVKEALERVLSFTTDDESLDEFCTEERETVIASANREPLRTPSVSTAQLNNDGSFPWAKALALSPPQQLRQLSAIPDTETYSEDLFSSSEQSQDWYDVKPDTASTVSFVDSGLGLSFKSYGNAQPEPIKVQRSKPVPISGSMPITAARPIPSMSTVFGKKRDLISKSWSDLWDEEEEAHHAVAEVENTFERKGGFKKEKAWDHFESESGVSTPRGGLTEVKNPATANNSRNRTPERKHHVDDRISEHTGFVFEDHTPAPRYSPPSKRTIMDKWAALGDRRRAQQTPQKAQKSPQPATKRIRASSWRRHLNFGQNHANDSGIWEQKEPWSASRDWRQHPNFSTDDVGDLEWVGGWHDLHL